MAVLPEYKFATLFLFFWFVFSLWGGAIVDSFPFGRKRMVFGEKVPLLTLLGRKKE